MENFKNLIAYIDTKSMASEAYKMLRTNLRYLNIDKENKIIVVTSANKGEGKTTTICNLAVTMAQTGKKVIVLDCDLRKPRVNALFGIKNDIGITNIVVESIQYEKAITTIKELPTLDIISTGPIPPDPAEILQSNAMKALIFNLKEKYDIVLIDVPPVCAVTDGVAVSAMADGVILVVASNETKWDAAYLCVKSLKQVSANILGIVLVKVKSRKSANYYYEDNKLSNNKAKRKIK